MPLALRSRSRLLALVATALVLALAAAVLLGHRGATPTAVRQGQVGAVAIPDTGVLSPPSTSSDTPAPPSSAGSQPEPAEAAQQVGRGQPARQPRAHSTAAPAPTAASPARQAATPAPPTPTPPGSIPTNCHARVGDQCVVSPNP